MEKVKSHIESITNGNSKGLAYWIAIGVVSLVLNFASDIVGMVTDDSSERIIQKQEKQIELLNKMINKLDMMTANQDDIEKKIDKASDKMEQFRLSRP